MQEQARSTPTDAPAQAPEEERSAAAAVGPPDPDPPAPVGFRSRGRARRRARFLRKARELAYRDLGGLVFSLHRFGQRNDPLVLAKLTTLGRIDGELRSLEDSLEEYQPISVLREAGIAACPRCAAIHSSEDGFCPNCGLPVDRHVDLPAGFQAPAAASGGAPAPSAAQAEPAPAPAPPAVAPSPSPLTQRGDAAPAPAPADDAGADRDSPTEILRPEPPAT